MLASWINRTSVWLCGSALFVMYLILLPSDLTWANFGGDGGDLLTAILRGGNPHPSGYPTYTLLGWVMQLIPFGSEPWKAALLSAVPAALAAALAGLWVQTNVFRGDRLAYLAGSITTIVWGSAPLFWSQAVVIEVHGLHALAVVGWLWWLSWVDSSEPFWKVGLLSLAAGFSVGNHLTILLLVPMAAWIFYRSYRNGRSLPFLLGQIVLALAAAGAIYATLILRASSNPPINWGGAQTWSGLLWLISGSPYANLMGGVPGGQLLDRLSAWAKLLLDQFWIPGILLGVWGAVQVPWFKTRQAGLLVWIFGVYTLFAIFYNSADSMIYLLPALLSFSIWIGVGVHSVWGSLANRNGYRKLAVGVVLMSILIHIPFTFNQVDPRGDTRAAHYMQVAQRTIPEDALVFTHTDAETFPLWYLHYGLEQHPNWRVVVVPLMDYPWYRENLAVLYPDLVIPEETQNWEVLLPAANAGRPVCRINLQDEIQFSPEIQCED